MQPYAATEYIFTPIFFYTWGSSSVIDRRVSYWVVHEYDWKNHNNSFLNFLKQGALEPVTEVIVTVIVCLY